MEITQTLARYIAELDYDRIPEDVKRVARRALIDTFGCAIAGSVELAARIATRAGCDDGGSRRATVLGAPPGVRGRLRLPPANAAMINAIAGHALDYDDVNPMGHPSVPVAFTALAAAEDARSSGRELLTAYVAGVELETKVMRAFSDSHYLHGWHSTNTLGVLGAATAAARVYRLDAAQFVNALGIAASQATGLRQNFGTMTKPFHPGHASWSGLTAVRLARLGFTADSAILEAPLGYLKVFSAGAYEPAQAVAHLDKWALIEPGLSVKKYPCCYCAHPSIDAALALRERDGIQPDEIVSIRAELSPFFLSPLIHHRPATGLEGKFSLEYALAAAMLDSRVALPTFTDAMVQRPEARQLIEKVTSVAREPSDGGLRATFVRLTVELTGGRRISHEVAEPRGTAANPLSDTEIEDKFRDCCQFAGVEPDRANRALATLLKIDRLKSLAPLASLLAVGTSAASSASETARAEEAAHRAASK